MDMPSALDIYLDDINQEEQEVLRWKIPRPGTRIRPRPRSPGNRTAPYSVGKHDMYPSQMRGFPASAARESAIETGTKLYISNLHYGGLQRGHQGCALVVLQIVYKLEDLLNCRSTWDEFFIPQENLNPFQRLAI